VCFRARVCVCAAWGLPHLVDLGPQELDVGAAAVDALLVLDRVLQHQVLALVAEGLGQLRGQAVEPRVLASLRPARARLVRVQSPNLGRGPPHGAGGKAPAKYMHVSDDDGLTWMPLSLASPYHSPAVCFHSPSSAAGFHLLETTHRLFHLSSKVSLKYTSALASARADNPKAARFICAMDT
jgi:hypothetical protein